VRLTSGLMWFMGVLFIRIWGTEWGRCPRNAETRSQPWCNTTKCPDHTWCFRDGRHLERSADDQNEVHALPIFLQRTVKVVCEFLSEESYTRLRESPSRVCQPCHEWGDRGNGDLHDPRRVIWEIGFIFALVIIPPAVLPLFLLRLWSLLRIFGCISIPRVANLAQRHFTGQYLLLDLGTDHFPTALNAGSGSERPVTLKDTFDPCGSLESVNVLGVILFVTVGEYTNRERGRCSKCHGVGPTRNSCRRRSVVAHRIVVRYNYFVSFFYELYEAMTRGGDKPGWVYVPAAVISHPPTV